MSVLIMIRIYTDGAAKGNPGNGVMVQFWIIKGSAKSWLKDFV